MSQRQDSLTDQMHDLMRLAVEEGMYDAHDWIRARWDRPANEAVIPLTDLPRRGPRIVRSGGIDWLDDDAPEERS